MTILEDKINEISLKHAEILENECKKACEKFNCNPYDLIIEYHANTEVKIKVNASHFSIKNTFTYDDGLIIREISEQKEITK